MNIKIDLSFCRGFWKLFAIICKVVNRCVAYRSNLSTKIKNFNGTEYRLFSINAFNEIVVNFNGIEFDNDGSI